MRNLRVSRVAGRTRRRGLLDVLRDRLPRGRMARRLARFGDDARDDGRPRDAVAFYREALRLAPSLAAVHVQAGNMLKDLGDHAAAQRHYEAARLLRPGDPDLSMQLGHLAKLCGQPLAAARHYRAVLRFVPDHADAIRELAALLEQPDAPAPSDEDAAARAGALLRDGLVPELLPRTGDAPPPVTDRLHLERFASRIERTPWGLLPSLRGVEAVRATCLSAVRHDAVRILLDDDLVAIAPVEVRADATGLFAHVVNVWIDVANRAPGPRSLAVELMAGAAAGPSSRRDVVVMPPLPEDAGTDIDAVVHPPAGEAGTLEARIRAMPSVVRPARALRPRPVIRSVLVARADQLGDLVISVPAIRRLRALLPEARLVGLLSGANADLARSLGLFDDIVTADAPLDPRTRRRAMATADQAALRRTLAAYRFDLAIDLSVSSLSRPLLLLSGATRLRGFDDGLWPWLDARLSVGEPDAKSSNESMAQSERVQLLIEQLAIALGDDRPIVPRTGDDVARLAAFGLEPRGYVVLHESTGHVYNRWPGFEALARELAETTPHAILLLTDTAGRRRAWMEAAPASGRLHVIGGMLPFEDLDALLANAAAFAGVDSGPKHLASLRGTPVVSIHSARTNWREWGQEHTGVIVSRRVPCAGCGIAYDDAACGKNFACISDIGSGEIAAALRALLSGSSPARSTSRDVE